MRMGMIEKIVEVPVERIVRIPVEHIVEKIVHVPVRLLCTPTSCLAWATVFFFWLALCHKITTKGFSTSLRV